MNALELQKLTDGYTPKQETLDALRTITLVALVGPTAAGKTTLTECLVKQDPSICRVISDVSRPPRKGEVHGMDYNFRSQADMVDDLQNGLYAQIVLSINGDLYGTRPSNYGDGSFAVIGVWAAAVSMFRALHFKEVKVIYVVPPDYDTWQQRVRTHQFTPEEYIRRMQEAKQSLDFATTDKDVQLVMNDDLSLACHRCMDITKSKSLTAPQLASQQQTEHVIKEILSRIS